MRQIFIDNETTGVDIQQGHRIIELGAVEVIDGKVTGNYFHAYINPERESDIEAEEIHGITSEFLRDKPKFVDILPDFYDFIHGADEILAHNAPWDVSFINNELTILNDSKIAIDKEYCVVDTLEIARNLIPTPRHNLQILCDYFGLNVENNTQYNNIHGALLDARLLADVYLLMKGYLSIYDKQVDSISHYKKYPNLKPLIGSNYTNAKIKLLVVGESHYLDVESTYHHDPEDWYEGIDISDKKDIGWMKTRSIIINGIKSNWKSRSKAIYRNIEKALFESELFEKKPDSVFSEISFMNFFQRPAEITGKSIKVSEEDLIVSKSVFIDVVNIIKPDVVVFTSSLAYKTAKKGGALDLLRDSNIAFTRTPHPGMPWWNRVSKAYNNKTGRLHFIDFINEQKSVIHY